MHLTIKMLQSLDGIISKNPMDKLDWGSSQDKKLYKKKTTECGTLIVGSNTFLATPAAAWKNRKVVVLSRNRIKLENHFWLTSPVNKTEEIKPNHTEENTLPQFSFIKPNPIEIIKYLESFGIQKAMIIGGGIINNIFLEAGLVDELEITLAPRIFGTGNATVFGDQELDVRLELIETQTIGPDELLLRYKVLR